MLTTRFAQLIRSLALRVMTGIRVKEVVHLQVMAVRQCTHDR